jgi:Domain of unknown function (DUF4331)
MMTTTRKAAFSVAIWVLLALVATFAFAPLSARAADHLDAPGLTSPGGKTRLDINDVYVFQGSDSSKTVLAATVNPAATGDTMFANRQEGAYHLRIDKNGDAVEDLTYSLTFRDRRFSDGQSVTVRRATGSEARDVTPDGKVVGFGSTEDAIRLWSGNGKAFTGLRSDPFFFDLGGFRGTVEGVGPRMLNDGMQSDFFEELNTLAIVLEVPDAKLGKQIGVWATTSSENGRHDRQVDRMGRPAINTVVNSSGPIVGADPNAKNVFNAGKPKRDVANFTAGTIAALQAFSSLDTEGAYSDAAADALAGVLLPDVITYDTATAAAGPLNGRALVDDVIDIELRIVTGGDPLGLFDDRDADGAINTDGIGPHDDYMARFPYLGVPHS